MEKDEEEQREDQRKGNGGEKKREERRKKGKIDDLNGLEDEQICRRKFVAHL